MAALHYIRTSRRTFFVKIRHEPSQWRASPRFGVAELPQRVTQRDNRRGITATRA